MAMCPAHGIDESQYRTRLYKQTTAHRYTKVHGPKMTMSRTFTMALLLLTILPVVWPRTPTPQSCKRVFLMCIKGKSLRRNCENKRDLCLGRHCVEDLKDRFSGSRAAYLGKLLVCAREHGLIYSRLVKM
ncbi:hypothetical protein ScPMuIL_006633 [Solemya velum]